MSPFVLCIDYVCEIIDKYLSLFSLTGLVNDVYVTLVVGWPLRMGNDLEDI